jgi:glutaredoxin
MRKIVDMSETIKIELLTSPGCHNCEEFKKFWESIKSDWPTVSYSEVSITEPAGQELVQKHVILSSPGLLINGELFSTGGVNQDEFVKKLEELSK